MAHDNPLNISRGWWQDDVVIGLIAILLTAVIIALISINMGVIGKFQNSEQSIEDKTNVANEIDNLNTNLLEIEKKSEIIESIEKELNE